MLITSASKKLVIFVKKAIVVEEITLGKKSKITERRPKRF